MTSDTALDYEVPATFHEWTLNNANLMIFDPEIEEQSSLHVDMTDYAAYLQGIPATGTFHRQVIWNLARKYNEDVRRLFQWEVRTFDFEPAGTRASWKDCVRKAYFLSADHVQARNKWYNVIAKYADGLYADDRERFFAARKELAVNDRRELEGKDRLDRRGVSLERLPMDAVPFSIFDLPTSMVPGMADVCQPLGIVNRFFEDDGVFAEEKMMGEKDGLLGSERYI